MILREFGFAPDPAIVSDPPGGLRYDLGPLRLRAGVCQAPFGPTVQVWGVLATGRSVAEVNLQLPQNLSSPELAAALLSYHLDRISGPEAAGALVAPWLTLGRQNQDLLPWEVERVARELLPRCMVRRDWMKLAIRDFRAALPADSPEDVVRISFDGEVLRLTATGYRGIVPAEGRAWIEQYAVRTADLDGLPRRWPDPVWLEYDDGRLRLGRRSIPAVALPLEAPGALEG